MSEMMVVAVPTVGEAGMGSQRSGHFGHCDSFTVVHVEAGEIKQVRPVDNPPHEDGGCLRPVNLLASEGVTTLVVAGMGARPLAGFEDVGIDVYFDNTTPVVGDVVSHLLEGTLPKMDSRLVCGGH